jgi:hypothetical protein
MPKVIYDLSFVNAWGKKRFFKRPTVSFSFFIYYRIRYVVMSPFFDGKGYGPNGDLGILDIGVSLQRETALCCPFNPARRVPAPGVFPPYSRAGNTPHPLSHKLKIIKNIYLTLIGGAAAYFRSNWSFKPSHHHVLSTIKW